MLAKVEKAFKELLTCLQTAKMYGTMHPMFQKSLDKAYAAFEDVLAQRQEMVIGIVGDELAFEKEILFDLGKLLRSAILYLKERNIERLAFYSGLSKEELGKFVGLLAGPKEDFKTDPQVLLVHIGVQNISIGKLKVDGRKENDILAGNQLELYNSSMDRVSQVLSSVLNSEKIDPLGLKFSLNNIIDSLGTQRQELLKLATVKRYDAEIYVHMLNVSIFAMYFASRLGFEKNDILDIGVAALFHDIGKLYISRKTLHKPDKLSEQEFNRIKSHTVLGAEFMFEYVDSLGILPVVVSFEHHLKYDSSGYPRMPLLRKQHIVSSIVAICDVYDALSQRRGYKQDYSPDVVYNIMNKDRGSAFDPELLDKFFRFMGFWPVGSVVALNDGSIALVKDENESDIRRPKVEIVFPKDKRRLVDLIQDNSLSIERYLNPWKEGREYLQLA
ncbi:MAG: HD domain-containing protein [Candidatus Omnitrophica bacterium]|nr:HD domain-containing protein [Candidatus Omnitrophota bacterium]MDD5690335.1 HD domain-containing protein [Candidatus Omnitrophota bacterium]